MQIHPKFDHLIRQLAAQRFAECRQVFDLNRAQLGPTHPQTIEAKRLLDEASALRGATVEIVDSKLEERT